MIEYGIRTVASGVLLCVFGRHAMSTPVCVCVMRLFICVGLSCAVYIKFSSSVAEGHVAVQCAIT